MFKKIILILVLSLLTLHAETAQADTCSKAWENILDTQQLDPLYQPLIGLCGLEFKKALWKKIATNEDLGYTAARKAMFSFIDNFDGKVCGVYSGECIKTTGIPDHRKYNTEHSWCQSWGATGTAKSDLHHLYPVKSNLNSKRNNYPFCEVSKETWAQYGSKFGKSYSSTTCFEPPNWHKGELARSMFYFSVRYSRPIDSEQEKFFKKWNNDYSVTDKEIARNEEIFYHQGNRNPFVQYPDFVKLISDF